jgi:hypothetical protein
MNARATAAADAPAGALAGRWIGRPAEVPTNRTSLVWLCADTLTDGPS